MVSVTAAGPPMSLPLAPSRDQDFFVNDSFLLHPDLAVINIGNGANFPGNLSNDDNLFVLLNPQTGDIKKLVGHSVNYESASAFRVDNDHVGFLGRGYNPDGVYGWEVGIVDSHGRHRHGYIPFSGAFSQSHTPQQNKEAMYSCYDPITRQVTFLDWLVYNNPGRALYGTAISLDTFQVTGQWRVWAAQQPGYYNYYEVFGTTFPGYSGAIGVEINDGEEHDTPHDYMRELWVVDNDRKRLVGLPLGAGIDLYLNEACIQQCQDDPTCVAITWLEYDSRNQKPSVARYLICRLYPKFEVMKGPGVIGTYESYPQRHPGQTDTIDQFWNDNFDDIPRMYTTKYLAQNTYASFFFTSFSPPKVDSLDGALVGVRALGDKPNKWGSWTVKAYSEGLSPSTSSYRRQFFLNSFSGDYMLICGDDYSVYYSGGMISHYYQLVKLTPRGTGGGAANVRTVAFT